MADPKMTISAVLFAAAVGATDVAAQANDNDEQGAPVIVTDSVDSEVRKSLKKLGEIKEQIDSLAKKTPDNLPEVLSEMTEELENIVRYLEQKEEKAKNIDRVSEQRYQELQDVLKAVQKELMTAKDDRKTLLKAVENLKEGEWDAWINYLMYLFTFLSVAGAIYAIRDAKKMQKQMEYLLADEKEALESLANLQRQVRRQLVDGRKALQSLAHVQKSTQDIQDQTAQQLVEIQNIYADMQTLYKEMLKFQKDSRDFASKLSGDLLILERLLHKFNYETSRANAGVYVSQTREMIGKKDDEIRRVGDFPETLPYLDQRVHGVKSQLILSMPFSLLGVLGNPRGQDTFYRTLKDRFDAAAKDKDRSLVLISYADEDRIEAARTRYFHSSDTFALLQRQALMNDFMEILDDADMREGFRNDVRNFQKGLGRGGRKLVAKLSDAQLRSKKSDQEFLEGLDNKKERKIFQKIIHIRESLGTVLAEQERMNCAREAEDFPDATFIKVPRGGLDNKITLCVDGIEVIRCFSSPTKLDIHENRVISELGPERVYKYRESLRVSLRKSDLSEEGRASIVEDLEKLIEASEPGL